VTRRRVVGVAVVVVVAVGAAGWFVLLAGVGQSGGRTVRTVRATTTTSTSTTVPPTTTTTVDPGTLPQTMAMPTTTDPQFQADLDGFWWAIVDDNPAPGMPFFFPLTAYLQVKAIANPASDWQNRLVAAYQRDIHSLHVMLGPDAATADLTGIDVPATAQWVLPGAEYNKGSYWRVYSSQLHYTVDGRAGSFTIASMISWRGEWYIVHLASIQ
jgi:hypothetical protein